MKTLSPFEKGFKKLNRYIFIGINTNNSCTQFFEKVLQLSKMMPSQKREIIK